MGLKTGVNKIPNSSKGATSNSFFVLAELDDRGEDGDLHENFALAKLEDRVDDRG